MPWHGWVGLSMVEGDGCHSCCTALHPQPQAVSHVVPSLPSLSLPSSRRAAVCSEFDARPVESDVATQPLLTAPRTVTAHYAVGDGEESDGKVRFQFERLG